MKQDLHSFVRMCCAVLLLTTLFPDNSFSQATESSSHIEAGITLGPANFLGDLGGNAGKGTAFIKDNNFSMTKFAFGAFVSYHSNELYGFRLAVNAGSLAADDAVIKSKGGLEEARKIRNSNFRSKMFDAMLVAEVYPTTLLEYDNSDYTMKFRPYVVAGIGFMKFNPRGQDPLTGRWVDLQPLRTEGQGFAEYPDRQEYKLSTMTVPLGIGVKYSLSEKVNVSFEIIHRKTFTDYIDDVSTSYVDQALFYNYMPMQQAQLAERMANKSGGAYDAGDKRGTSSNNDSYYTAGFKLGIRLGGGSRYGNSINCPIRF